MEELLLSATDYITLMMLCRYMYA